MPAIHSNKLGNRRVEGFSPSRGWTSRRGRKTGWGICVAILAGCQPEPGGNASGKPSVESAPPAAVEAPVEPTRAAPDDPLLKTIERARSFEGGSLGFGAEESEASKAFKKLLARREPAYFRSLLASGNPAARVYGIHGLESLGFTSGFDGRFDSVLPLLDDDERVNLFVNCEHSVSQVSIETFRSLAAVAPEEIMDELTTAIFREAARAERESRKDSSGKAHGKSPRPKLTMALHRARTHPTLASLAYLLMSSHDLEGAEALLATALDSGVRSARRAAIERALESEQASIRGAAARVAARIYRTEYFASIEVLCGDRDPDVRRAALDALTGVALAALDPDAVAAGRPDAETIVIATLERLRAALDRGGAAGNDAASSLERLAAGAIPEQHSDAEDGAETTRTAVSAKLRELVQATLIHALINGHGRQLELAAILARAGGNGARVVDVLTGDISGIDPRAMSVLVDSIERNAESRTRFVESAIERLREKSEMPWKAKLYLVRALGQLREPRAREVLTALQGDAHARVAEAAKKALAELEGGEAAHE